MQLTIDVLPAPLGPIMENSSPALTPKLTSVSARTPPKRSDTPSTSKAYSTLPSVTPTVAKLATCFAIRKCVIQMARLPAFLVLVWRQPGSTRFTATGHPVSTGPTRQRMRLPQGARRALQWTLVLGSVFARSQPSDWSGGGYRFALGKRVKTKD